MYIYNLKSPYFFSYCYRIWGKKPFSSLCLQYSYSFPFSILEHFYTFVPLVITCFFSYCFEWNHLLLLSNNVNTLSLIFLLVDMPTVIFTCSIHFEQWFSNINVQNRVSVHILDLLNQS